MFKALSNLRDRISDGLNVKAMTFPAQGGGAGGSSPYSAVMDWGNPGGKLDYSALAGEPSQNSVVSVCLNWYINTIHAAPPCVKAVNDKAEKEVVPGHALTRLLLRPNPNYAGSTLWAGTILSYRTVGRAYWFKVRNALGQVAELYYVPHFQIKPLWDDAGREYITGYEYRVNNKILLMKPEDVIHFRFGLNPFNIREGMNPLGGVMRSLVQKNEADTYGAALLRNRGVPSALLTPKDPMAQFDDPELIKAKIKAYVGGDNSGDILALDGAIELTKLGYSPEELALDKLDTIPTTLICAAMGLDPMVLGLPSASKTYDNYSEAIDAAWQGGVMPMHANFGETLDVQLLTDNLAVRPGEAKPDPATQTVEWDYSGVSAFAPDVDDDHARAREDFQANLLTRAEAKREIGFDPADDGSDDVHYADIAPVGGGGLHEGLVGDVPASARLIAANRKPPVRAAKSADGVTWITVNGRHIPIGADGKPHFEHPDAGKIEEKAPSPSAKSQLAKQSATYVGSEIQQYAEEHNEPAFAKSVGGLSLKDNEPMDVLVLRGGGVAHGIELKTMVSNKAAKITMKADAMERKAQWMATNHAPFHTVVYDDHAVFNAKGPGEHDEGKRRIYYKRGFGSFRVASMHPVKDAAELKTLLDTADNDLPTAAKPPSSYPGVTPRNK